MLPFAGWRNPMSAKINQPGNFGGYRASSVPRSYADNAYYMLTDSSRTKVDASNYRTYGYPVRCFKDEYDASKFVTFNLNG